MRLHKSGQSWVLHTPAKLNLFLEVLGKRDDGFHELQTLMVTVSLFDTLVFTEESTPHVSLRCHDAGCALRTDARTGRSSSMSIPEGADNLAVRAAELLRSRIGVRNGIHIDLYKRIPAAAGLAGGSSNAAATLFALNRIHGLGLSRQELQQFASEIGSDVSFFLSPSSTALCEGRGEITRPVTLSSRLYFVIAKPASGLSTTDVFRNCRPESSPRGAAALLQSLHQGNLQKAGSQLFNSLQAPAEALNPELQRLKRNFARQRFVGHMMSGSGTAWFGVCRHRHEAMTAAARLRASGPDRVFVAETSL
ncbi:4-(cytidine 5'-diphospho)-2-C-methyl-D-erythritol kinase [bacterium]|nr:4-(cytidine 5'-diphospho)-2-C-methyl-D-erythritol kinase [bacterium]